jgi:hypothetical protein
LSASVAGNCVVNWGKLCNVSTRTHQQSNIIHHKFSSAVASQSNQSICILGICGV